MGSANHEDRLGMGLMRTMAGNCLSRIGRLLMVALIGCLAASAAHALPAAMTWEYFGINGNVFTYPTADYLANPNGGNILNYAGLPGCGGTCTATTVLAGPNGPSASIQVNEVAYNDEGAGQVQSELSYYVTYTPNGSEIPNGNGTYNIQLNASDEFGLVCTLNNGCGEAQAYVGFGQAYTAPYPGTISQFRENDFSGGPSFQETDCAVGTDSNPADAVDATASACGVGVANYTAPAAFGASMVEMLPNVPYLMEIWVTLDPATAGADETAEVDPTLSDLGQGGTFTYSDGVGFTATPEPATWTVMLAGLAGLLALRRRGQGRGAAYAGS
jgi:hypothetical protein